MGYILIFFGGDVLFNEAGLYGMCVAGLDVL